MRDRRSGGGEPRVLVVLPSLCAEGTPVLTLDLCDRWMALGIEPTIVTLLDRPNDLAPEFRDHGVAVERMRLPVRGLGRFSSLATATYELCRRLRPQAVLSMPLGWHSFMFTGARGAGVPRTAAHVGNYPPAGQDPRSLSKFRCLIQIGRPVTDRLICCSSYIQEGVIHHFGVSRAETEVIYNGVDVEAFSRRAESRATPTGGLLERGPVTKPFVIGMVARYEVHKDHPTLIRAAALLRREGRSIEVWLVGEGSRRAEYQRLIHDLDLDDTVKLLGVRRDVPELLGQMDVFVFSAKPDEGLGVALIEAMAARTPIVATDVGACREVLLDGQLGDLVPAADPATMARALDRYIAQGSPRDPLRIEQARKRALTTFSIDEMAIRYARVLDVA